MNFDNAIATAAFSIGFYQMYNDVLRSDKMEESAKGAVMLGIMGSILWFVYQSRKYGMNFTTAYTGIGLVIQLYVLGRIIRSGRKSERRSI